MNDELKEIAGGLVKPIEPEDLWNLLKERSAAAKLSGALEPIQTDCEFVEQAGIRFEVRIVTALARKMAEKRRIERKSTPANPGFDPFLPYDPALFVADIGLNHVGLLNKFNVVEHHLLIVTRRFESQTQLLTREDFVALEVCLTGFEGLGFYNGGSIAGASQPHRHLQYVPLPLVPGGCRMPMEFLVNMPDHFESCLRHNRLPFGHAFARRAISSGIDLEQDANEAHSLYLRLFESLDYPVSSSPGGFQPIPYNLLVTREWMLLVPRFQEHFETISMNALAFAGAILVSDSRELESIIRWGPMTALKQVAFPTSRTKGEGTAEDGSLNSSQKTRT